MENHELIRLCVVAISALLLFGLALAALKGLGIYLTWREKRFKDNEAEFIADLYNIQQKWAKRGFSKGHLAMQAVINAFNLPPEKNRAKTKYGNDTMEQYEKEVLNG